MKIFFTICVESPWELYFDGVFHIETDPDGAQRRRAGAGLIFKTLRGETILPFILSTKGGMLEY
jgi:hypothetical protein